MTIKQFQNIRPILNVLVNNDIIVMSWGISNFEYDENNVSFNVNGLKYRGNISIKCSFDKLHYRLFAGKHLIKECFLEEIVSILDNEIEKDENYLTTLKGMINLDDF